MYYNGWTKKALWVDLSTRRSWTEDISQETCARFLGGRGFVIKTLYEHVGAGVKPLDPENLLIFAIGPTAGTPFPGRMTVMTKSPQTGRFADGNGGGYFTALLHVHPACLPGRWVERNPVT